jgi:hypothetical protein
VKIFCGPFSIRAVHYPTFPERYHSATLLGNWIGCGETEQSEGQDVVRKIVLHKYEKNIMR